MTDASAEAEVQAAVDVAKAKLTAALPLRPRDLKPTLLSEYLYLALTVLLFVGVSLLISYDIPDQMFELRNGTLIPIESFDPAIHGPYPSCHPQHGKHLAADGVTFVDNSEVKEPGPFPIGHPRNDAWRNRTLEDNLSAASIQPSIHLLLISILTLFVGTKHAVFLYARPGEDEGVEEERDLSIHSTLQDSDAYRFPVMGSLVLFSLFIVYKFLDAEWIKFLFSVYVVLMCINGLAMNLGHYVALRFNYKSLKTFAAVGTIPYFDVRITRVDILTYIVSTILGMAYLYTKHWVVNNIMAISFCILALKLIGLASYKTGAIMLIGLFFYDVFWVFGSEPVFGSNVMVTVAQGVEAPIVLKFPRGQDGCGKMQFSMLGLGDIVVPGIFISLLAKWDVNRIKDAAQAKFAYFNAGESVNRNVCLYYT